MADVSYELMQRNNLSADDIAWLVPHQPTRASSTRHGQPYGTSQRKSNDQYSEIRQYHSWYITVMPVGMENQLKAAICPSAAFGGGIPTGRHRLKWAYNSQ